MVDSLPPLIAKRLSSWNRFSTLLRLAHVILGSIGVVCPIIVGSFADTLKTPTIQILSFAGAACVGLIAAFRIGQRANQFVEARKLLDAAVLRYKSGTICEKDLVDAYEDGERLIGKTKEYPFEGRSHHLDGC